MNDDDRKIIISRISEFHQNESGEYQRVPISPVNRWFTYAILIPVIMIMAVMGIFFFAAFLALLVVAVLVVGVRFWWLRKKYENTLQQSGKANRQPEANQDAAIEDAQIIEEAGAHRAEQRRY